jgi:hypothetical protein
MRFHFDTIPEHVKTRADLLLHRIMGASDSEQTPSRSMASAQIIEEGTNLFEVAQAVARQSLFVSCREADLLAEMMSAKLGLKVCVNKEPNREAERLRQEAENARRGALMGEKIAKAMADAIAKAMGLPEIEEPVEPEISPTASSVQEPVELTEDERFVVTSIDIRTIEVFREAIALLREAGYLSSEEGLALSQHPLAAKIDEQIVSQRTLSYTLSPTQREVLRGFFRPHITEIMERCSQFETADQLLGHVKSWARFDGVLNPRAIAFAALVSSASGSPDTFVGEQFGGLRELRDDVAKLNTIYGGYTGQEELLKEQGIPVPSLENQRLALFELFEEMLTEKFGEEDLSDLPVGLDPFLVREVRKQLFVAGHSLEVLTFSARMTIAPFKRTVEAIQGNYSFWTWHFNEEENTKIRTSIHSIVQRAREKVESDESRAASSV